MNMNINTVHIQAHARMAECTLKNGCNPWRTSSFEHLPCTTMPKSKHGKGALLSLFKTSGQHP